MYLPQFTVTQHAKVDLVVFCRFTDKCTFLDCENEKRDPVYPARDLRGKAII
jgi:hypothetical protein